MSAITGEMLPAYQDLIRAGLEDASIKVEIDLETNSLCFAGVVIHHENGTYKIDGDIGDGNSKELDSDPDIWNAIRKGVVLLTIEQLTNMGEADAMFLDLEGDRAFLKTF